jgi:hypothetical protein
LTIPRQGELAVPVTVILILRRLCQGFSGVTIGRMACGEMAQGSKMRRRLRSLEVTRSPDAIAKREQERQVPPVK